MLSLTCSLCGGCLRFRRLGKKRLAEQVVERQELALGSCSGSFLFLLCVCVGFVRFVRVVRASELLPVTSDL